MKKILIAIFLALFSLNGFAQLDDTGSSNNGSMTLGTGTGTLHQFAGDQRGTDGTNQSQGGFGILSGANQISPIIWMFGNGNLNAFQVRRKGYNSTVQNGSVMLHVGANSLVGIGTDSPTRKLDVRGDFVNGVVSTSQDGYNMIQGRGALLQLKSYGDNTSSFNQWSLYSHTTNGDLYFRSQSDISNAVDHMTLMDNGNIGIGTIDPTYKLQIEEVSGSFTFGRPGTEMNHRLTIDANSAYENQIYFRSRPGRIFTINQNLILGSSTTSNNLVISGTNGNIGVGTSSPSQKLHINSGYNGLLVNGAMGGNNFTDHQVEFTFTDGGVSESGVKFNKKNAGSNFDLMNAYYNGGEVFVIRNNGKVGIGTDDPNAMLTVAGNIESQEVKVTVDAGQGPDYVFEEDYNLRSLEETEEFIKENKHLPEVPSAKVMESEGLNLKEMNLKLLQKIEELTLHMIEQNKEIESLKTEMQNLKSK